jgi:hypothetical protein
MGSLEIIRAKSYDNRAAKLQEVKEKISDLDDYDSGIVVYADEGASRLYVFVSQDMEADDGRSVDQAYLNESAANCTLKRVPYDGLAAGWGYDSRNVVEYQGSICCADCLSLFLSRVRTAFGLS